MKKRGHSFFFVVTAVFCIVWLTSCDGAVSDTGGGGSSSGTGGGGGGTQDTTAPAVSSTNPSSDETDVSLTATVSATFSEDVSSSTLTTSSFTVTTNSTSVAGTVSYSSSTRTATFTPSSSLSYSTQYTATVTTAVQDLAGNPMSSDYSWTFTTESYPLPFFPLSTGNEWLYGVDRTYGWWSSYGGGSTDWVGNYFLYAIDEVEMEGEQAMEFFLLKLRDSGGDIDTSYFYLVQDSEGLHRCSGPGGSWRTVLSTQSLSFTNNTFIFAYGPAHSAPSELSVEQVTVPAGTFLAMLTEHHFKQTGQYAPEDIFEDNYEHYADQIGLVKSRWNYHFDDNDPQGTDFWNNGEIVLEYMNTGPIPELFIESEPNDSWSSVGLPSIEVPGVIIGDTLLGDSSQFINDPNVAQNNNGESVINDWYKFTLPVGQTVTINMKFEHWENDLDLYLFQELAGPSLSYVARSLNPQGDQEQISLFLGSGTYYIGVQAWMTPSGRSEYWLSVKIN